MRTQEGVMQVNQDCSLGAKFRDSGAFCQIGLLGEWRRLGVFCFSRFA